MVIMRILLGRRRRTCRHRHDPAYQFYLENIFTWLSLLLETALPVLILVVCDVIMARSLLQAARMASSFSAADKRGATDKVSNKNCPSLSSQPGKNSNHSNDSNRRMETAKRTTATILLVSLTFLLLTLPNQVERIKYLLISHSLENA